jgi:hypothetical protein
MKTPTWKTFALAALLTTIMPTVAAATTETLDPIPTMLVATDDTTGYPDPICSKCTIIVVEDEGSAGTQASVRIAYPVDAPSFAGEIAATVLLTSGEQRELWLSSVRLEPGAEVELVAEAESDWSWNQVRFVWLQFLAK